MCIRDSLNTAGFRMVARFEALTAENHVKLNRILRQIAHRHDLAAVSYTHLDVYKRQDVYSDSGNRWDALRA